MAAFTIVLTTAAQPRDRDRDRKNLTLSVVGNKDLRLTVDGRDQLLANTVVTGNTSAGNIERIGNGQHTMQITRTNPNTNRLEQINTVFIMRKGFDLDITVTGNGSLELVESRGSGNNNDALPMATTTFNNLLRSVRMQRSMGQRVTFETSAFNNADYSFSVAQVDQLLQLIDGEQSKLQLAKLSYRSVTDPENFYLLYPAFNEGSRTELYNYVYTYEDRGGRDRDGGNGGYGGYGNTAMSDTEFQGLLQTIKQQWPPSTQMNSITDAFNNTSKFYTSSQASQLIQLINSESSRLRLAKLSYRGIVDRNNFYIVSNLLSFQSSKDDLAAYVSGYKDNTGGNNDNNNYRAMSETEYNGLYELIRSQWPPSTQLTTASNAFNDPNKYFTAAQASKIIRLFNFEGDKLQLAKYSYRGIVDRNNMNQVIDVLSFQASKDELNNFIRNYKDDNNNNYNNDNNYGKTPVSDSKFYEIKQDIQGRIFPGEKMSALQVVFNDTRYNFTSQQAKQLIELVSLEANRLTLAKLSYRSITDRNNFRLVYDLLYNASSKTELDNYISGYRD